MPAWQHPLSQEKSRKSKPSGSSDPALVSASKHADYYLTWLEPFEQLRDKFRRVKEKTDALGRGIKCAVRVDILARNTEEEAWAEIERGFAKVSAEDLRRSPGIQPATATLSVPPARPATAQAP